MPKVMVCTRAKLESYVKILGDGNLSTDGHVILCKICERQVTADRKSQITQHLNGARHKSLLIKKTQATSSSVVQIGSFLKTSGRQSKFKLDLREALVSAGIPLRKLENAKLKRFLGTYSKEQIPCPSTLRKIYLESVYEQKLEFIRNAVDGTSIWLSIDERTDVTGRSVAHTVVGTLGTEGTKSFLLHAESLEKTNSSTISQAFMNSLAVLWPDGIQHEKVLLFVSDGAAYMKKAGAALKVIFSKMLHVTCAAHAVHSIAEEVRLIFPDVDRLVANGKKVFRKSAARVIRFREIAPGTALPPQPILTRWGTRIDAAIYYARNLEVFSSVIYALDASEAASIRVVQQLLEAATLKDDLAFIDAHFGALPKGIAALEEQNVPLVGSTEIFENLLLDLKRTPGSIGEKIRRKCDHVLRDNPDYHQLKRVANILRGYASEEPDDDILSPSELASLKFAPITSVDVERSFSMLKHTLSDRRRGFTFEHLKQVLVVYCNQ
ncbi:uncharacterized protein LOC100902673 [Galendromus occidentalis]|uniref:Uncharacterized protein LOC100902673 n=1 Tax=Galendromus occidentalis TaxID=34638 RepID=A0AAJ6VVL9_9ACAR|nr:uncharacterized protein LOC100902673 [Galendromus occidentalis]